MTGTGAIDRIIAGVVLVVVLLLGRTSWSKNVAVATQSWIWLVGGAIGATRYVASRRTGTRR